ncbi:hypothetical protein FALCPG4_007453 [Fusarium falciforme]
MMSTPAPDGPRPKRLRAAQACDLCRVKKNKCDELYPCSHCKSRNAKCVYRGENLRGGRNQNNYISHLEEQVRDLSAALTLQSNGTQLPTFQPPEGAAELAQDELEVQDPSGDAEPRDPRTEPLTEGYTSKEVYGVNRHTRNVEFYGSSSSVVLLSEAQKAGYEEGRVNGGDDESELVSSLHNSALSPDDITGSKATKRTRTTPPGSATHYRQCHPFLNSFFMTLHYLQPMIDKAEFLAKCTALWESATSTNQSFVALYYSVLSLGALVAIRDEELIDGIENLQWSRIFFEEARSRASINMVTDIETVQCYFILVRAVKPRTAVSLMETGQDLSKRVEPPLCLHVRRACCKDGPGNGNEQGAATTPEKGSCFDPVRIQNMVVSLFSGDRNGVRNGETGLSRC